MCNAHNLLLNIYVYIYIYINILLWIHLFLLIYLTCFLLNMTSIQLTMPPFHSFPCLLIAHHTVPQHCREMLACISDSLQWHGCCTQTACPLHPQAIHAYLPYPISQLLMQGCGYEVELLNTWTKYSRVYVMSHHLVLSIKSGYNF
jgi:hypothetical protein